VAPAFFRPTYPLYERGPIGGKCSHSVKGGSSPIKRKFEKNMPLYMYIRKWGELHCYSNIREKKITLNCD